MKLLLTAVFFLLFSLTNGQPQETDLGDYIVVYWPGNGLNWWQANAYCSYHHGTSLASFHSQADVDLMLSGVTDYDSQDCTWIGLNDINNEAGNDGSINAPWEYADGSDYDWELPWYPGEPTPNNNADCVYYGEDSFGEGFVDVWCTFTTEQWVCNGDTRAPSEEPTEEPTEEPDCVWTDWLDRDDPSTTGDWERIWDFWNDDRYENGVDVCGRGVLPIDSECREVGTGIDFEDYPFSGPYINLYCSPTGGFLCRDNDDSNYAQCPDFEVRFCCPDLEQNVNRIEIPEMTNFEGEWEWGYTPPFVEDEETTDDNHTETAEEIEEDIQAFEVDPDGHQYETSYSMAYIERLLEFADIDTFDFNISNETLPTNETEPNDGPTPCEEEIFGADRRRMYVLGTDTRVEITGIPTAQVSRHAGYLTFNDKNGGGWRCSAMVIYEQHILTAGHCVHSGGSGGDWFRNFRFWPRRTSTYTPTSFGWTQAWSFKGWTKNKKWDWDIAVIRLDGKPNVGWPAFGYSSSVAKEGHSIHTRSYPGDKGITMQAASGTVWQRKTHLYRSKNIDLVGGSSGGPMYAYKNGARVVYGVVSHEGSTTTGILWWRRRHYYNGIARITSTKFDSICRWTGRCSGGGGNNGCFSADSLVLTSRGHIKVRDVKVGDNVLTLNGFEQVIHTAHFVDEDGGKDLQKQRNICYNYDHNSNNWNCIQLSYEHMLFVNDLDTLKPAKDVKIGDTVFIKKIDSIEKYRVSKIEENIISEYRNVFTESGTIVVDNVVASSFTGKNKYDAMIHHYMLKAFYYVFKWYDESLMYDEYRMFKIRNFMYYNVTKPFTNVFQSFYAVSAFTAAVIGAVFIVVGLKRRN